MERQAEKDVNAYLDSLLRRPYYASLNSYRNMLELEEKKIERDQITSNINKNIGSTLIGLVPDLTYSAVENVELLKANPKIYVLQVIADALKSAATSPYQPDLIPNEPGPDYYSKRAAVQDKKAYLNSTPYRYILFDGGEDIYPSSFTHKFRNELRNRIKDIVSGKIPIGIPGASQEENSEYCNRYVRYLADILYMNEHRGKFEKDIHAAYDAIDQSYRK